MKIMKKKKKMKQGYNARKDESMGMKSGKESSEKMSMASRRKVYVLSLTWIRGRGYPR